MRWEVLGGGETVGGGGGGGYYVVWLSLVRSVLVSADTTLAQLCLQCRSGVRCAFAVRAHWLLSEELFPLLSHPVYSHICTPQQHCRGGQQGPGQKHGHAPRRACPYPAASRVAGSRDAAHPHRSRLRAGKGQPVEKGMGFWEGGGPGRGGGGVICALLCIDLNPRFANGIVGDALLSLSPSF